ncbi:MAG: hypothetical protein Q9211_004531 [Gyalolechia sp. 1 TL-2023]
MLNSKVYIVTTPELVSSVNRSSRVLTFSPFIIHVVRRITGYDENTARIVEHNINGEGPGLYSDTHHGDIQALGDPNEINMLTLKVLQGVSKRVQESEINLFSWVRQVVATCATTAFYGPDNPLAQEGTGLVEDFWFLLASKADRGRSNLVSAFHKYFDRYRPGITESSAYALARYNAQRKYNVGHLNAARLEFGALFGILANAVPATFYTLMHIYSDEELLHQIRQEVETTSVVKCDPAGTARTLNIASVRQNCNLLQATFKEVLRHYGRGASARHVSEDMMLDNQYLLKKGMVVLMPMAALHKDRSAWGDDASSFRPSRFLKDGVNDSKAHLASFRPFGGGANMCPGRHFATSEVMAISAYVVLSFSMEPADGGILEIPQPKQRSIGTAALPPQHDVRVRLKKREGYENVRWDFSVS